MVEEKVKKNTKLGTHEIELPFSPVVKKNPKTNYSQNILKTVIGTERAQAYWNSISMQNLPNIAGSNLTLNSNICDDIS